MTCLQEIQWLEELTEQTTLSHSTQSRVLHSRHDIFRTPWLHALLSSRWPQFLVRTITLLGFIFTITTALSGTRVGSHNFAIIMVWITWWTTLKLGFIPMSGRSWCSVCPIPLAGDWLQQGGILGTNGQKYGLNLRWPKHLRTSWLQSGGFLVIGLFSAVTLTDPRVTGWVILGLFVFATVLSLVFQRRTFCSYICPIAGFSGIYAKATPIEVRVMDKAICINHEDKACYHACPWGLYPLAFTDSAACGLCMECLRACPKDNLALNLRPYGADLVNRTTSSRLDEAFLALVMLGSALAFSAVFVGPWGWLKSAAYEIGSRPWMAYGVGFLALTLLILPALYTGCTWLWKKLSRSSHPLKQLLSQHAQGLIPLGLLGWIAFTISFALPKFNLVLAVLNDPFGWGWHLLTAANTFGSLDVSGFSPYLQVILLLVGVFWSVRVTQKLSRQDIKRFSIPNLPLLAFYLMYTGALLWILVG